jgi:riboflavin kinase/FMN adenylyltransferase
MEYQTSFNENKQPAPIVISIGNFDGLHRGHQRLLQELHTLAAELDSIPVLVTFTPHTLAVVRPESQLHLLTTIEEKLFLARKVCDVAESIVITFTPDVLAMSTSDFLQELMRKFTIRGMVEGEDFRIKPDHTGDMTYLQNYGKLHDLVVRSVPLQKADHERISSTHIRHLVREGNIPKANELLGHPFVVGGVVVHGDARGRELKFPTANIHPIAEKVLPPDGVYAARTYLHDGTTEERKQVYESIAYIGTRPTYAGTERRVETHLLDIDIDLYERYISVEFISRLRGDISFSDGAALQQQVFSVDIPQAREILAHYASVY